MIAAERATSVRSRGRAGRALVILLVASGPLAAGASGLPTDVTMLGETCTGCHGTGGISVATGVPSIAGLDKIYLARVMVQFRNNERPATIMDRIAKGYTESELRQMAKHFGGMGWTGWQGAAGAEGVEEGRRIHEQICAECHEREGRHQDRDTPRLAGQVPEYLYLSLLQYRDERGTTALPQPSKMLDALKPLSDAQLQLLARYYASRD